MRIDIRPRIVKPPFGSVQVDWGHPLARRLLGAWMFNEGVGAKGKAFSLTGRNDVVLTTGASAGTGRTSVALALDGTAGRADTTIVNTVILSGSAFTVAAWAKKNALGAMMLVSNNNDLQTLYQFYLRIGSNMGFTAGANNFQFISTADVSLGVWHHHVVTYNGATLVYYLDGALNTSGAATGVPDNPNARVSIGTDAKDAGAQFWNGVVDQAVIANRAWSQAEVLQHFAEPYAFLRPIPAVRYWSTPSVAAAVSASGTHVLYLGRAA